MKTSLNGRLIFVFLVLNLQLISCQHSSKTGLHRATPFTVDIEDANKALMCAKIYCWQLHSDAAEEERKLVELGLESKRQDQARLPDDFTIGGIFFSRYKAKMYYESQAMDRTIVVVMFYDPNIIQDWENMPVILDGYPSSFSLRIDLSTSSVMRFW